MPHVDAPRQSNKSFSQLKAAQDVVAGLQQERLVTGKELEALEAAEMAWLVRSKRPLSMPNSPSKERLSGIGGEREHAQAVGREQEEREREKERERRSAEALHQAKCLWVGRAVDDKVCVSADSFFGLSSWCARLMDQASSPPPLMDQASSPPPFGPPPQPRTHLLCPVVQCSSR